MSDINYKEPTAEQLDQLAALLRDTFPPGTLLALFYACPHDQNGEPGMWINCFRNLPKKAVKELFRDAFESEAE